MSEKKRVEIRSGPDYAAIFGASDNPQELTFVLDGGSTITFAPHQSSTENGVEWTLCGDAEWEEQELHVVVTYNPRTGRGRTWIPVSV